jgi:putative serine protease PepD
MTSNPAGDQARGPVLVARLGRQQHVFPVGMQIRVGRDPALELVSVNPLVSRDTHGLITSDEKGAVYTDRSRRGTFLDGKRLNGPLRITESVILRLGDPATGEELGITPPLSSAELELNRERRARRGRVRLAAIAVGAVAVAGGIAAGAFAVIGSPGSSGKQAVTTIPTVSALARPEAATVRLLQGSQSSYSGWGSGTLIAPDGLILTNAHVAEPQAPGLAVALGEPASQLEQDPPYLTVELTTGPASPVKARYRARPVAVDGYLDLAVVKIYATSNGTPVNPATLHLPYLTTGNDAAVQLDQTVTVLGFPGVADSDSITVTSGVISTFVPDPLGHVTDPRFELETTARLAHGNSGGAAVNAAGQLIGVPSLEVTGEGGDLSWRLRSVTEAQSLIAKAKAGRPYQSKILVQRTGAERATGAGVGASQGAACGGGTATQAAASAVFGTDFGGVPAGLDLAMLVELPDGSAVTVSTGGLPQLTATLGSGCFAIQVSAAQLGLAELPSGTYHIQLYGGPILAPIGTATAVAVGDHGPAGAP